MQGEQAGPEEARAQIDQVREDRLKVVSVDIFVSLMVISLFGYLSLSIMAPFVPILLWAMVLAVALYPVFLWLKGKLGSGGRAATVIGLVSLVLIIGPTIKIVSALLGSIGELTQQIEAGTLHVPPPSEGVKDWPLIGKSLHTFWQTASTDLSALIAQYGDQLKSLAGGALKTGAGLVVGVLQFVLSVLIAAAFLTYADPLADMSRNLAGRIASQRGRAMVDMAGKTIRNVSRGVVGVALLQGGLAALGIIALGMPFAGFLAAAAVLACTIQVPPLVIVPLIIYAWSTETALAAGIFTAYMVPVLFLDNVLKPILMARGLTTPMVVILIGVIGGTLTYGLLGLFVGPVILALFYEMVRVWTGYQEAPDAGEAEPEET